MDYEKYLRQYGVIVLIAILVGAITAAITASIIVNNNKGDNNGIGSPSAAMNLDKSVIKNPSDIPAPVGARAAMNVSFTLVTEEVTAKLDDGTSFTFWTFNGTVPGPLIRVRVNDNVTIHLQNPATSTKVHSVDLHAANKAGGGAVATQAPPGTTSSVTFQANWEGAFVYHCASPHIPTHISHGMFGAISVEPATGLPVVDKEFYLGQNELYTKWNRGTKGQQEFSPENQLDENAQYVMFNGAANALIDPAYSPVAKSGDTVRIIFAVGGPNLMSSFHLIGGVWNRVWYETYGNTPNMLNAETIVVPPGSTVMVEMDVHEPATFILVDHAISRAIDKGCIGYLIVEP